jgi:hypothetical protein
LTLPAIGTTAGSQAANQSVAATSTAAGAITFPGLSGIQGSTITAVVTVPDAPATAIFTATLGTPGGQGVVLDTWGGESTAGQFQILIGQTLVVTGTGLGASTQYTCTYGTVTDVGPVQTVIPAPNSSSLTATIYSLGIGSLIETLSAPVSGTAYPVTIPFSIRTLIIEVGVLAGNTITKVQVQGNSSNFNYYNAAPYLVNTTAAGGLGYLIVVPIISPVDSTVNVTLTAGGLGTIVAAFVYGDTAEYDQSLFYNGPVTAATATADNNTVAIVSGPVRLLTAHLELDANAISGSGFLEINGVTMARLDQVAAGDAGIDVSFAFPPNTILQAGQSLAVNSSVNGLFAIGSCTYAYP